MNIERFHRILLDLNSELTKDNCLNLIQQVQTHLQNQVTQPSQPAHQTNLVNSLKALNDKLKLSSYNNYSPSWK